jgi:hypothetical protein
MSRMVFATGSKDPVVQLLNLNTGEATPVPSRLDGSGAFDRGLGRKTWVAVQVGYKVAAFRDGKLADPILLPHAWDIFPAADPDSLLIHIYGGRTQQANEGTTVAVVDVNGDVLRSMVLPWGPGVGVVGEVESGVVASLGICTWRGQVLPLPDEGLPIGVLNGRTIVLESRDRIATIDIRTMERLTCVLPTPSPSEDLPIPLRPRVKYAGDDRRLMPAIDPFPGVCVVDASQGPFIIPLDFSPIGGFWRGGKLLLEDHPTLGSVELDVDKSTLARVAATPTGPRVPHPRVDVSGRFDTASGIGSTSSQPSPT